jgi:hypothetical protein
MKSPDRANPCANIGDTPDPRDMVKAPALPGITGNENDLIHNTPQGTDKPLNKSFSFVHEEVLFMTTCTAGISPDKYYSGSHIILPVMQTIP